MLYIVHIAVDRDRAEQWTAWMRDTHLADLLATECFASATLTRDEAADTDSRLGFSTFYLANNPAALKRYIDAHAARLRDDHLALFGGAVSATRQELPVIAHLVH